MRNYFLFHKQLFSHSHALQVAMASIKGDLLGHLFSSHFGYFCIKKVPFEGVMLIVDKRLTKPKMSCCNYLISLKENNRRGSAILTRSKA